MSINGSATSRLYVHFKEIRIPVPWGHIAGKEYGKPNGHHVLALHGTEDNCGTFDTLIPLLSPDLHIIAVDLPGHGLSSHKPPGAIYHVFDFMVDVHRVILHLQWKQFSLIGHSLGAALVMMYSAMYPDSVVKTVALEQITSWIFPVDSLAKRITMSIGQLLQCERTMSLRKSRPIAKDLAVGLLKEVQGGSMTEATINIQLKRATTPFESSGKVVFNNDTRLVIKTLPDVTPDQVKSMAKHVKCDVMLVWAKQGLMYNHAPKEVVDDLIEFYKTSLKTFKIVEVDGTHHVHINNPEVVAPHINAFFQLQQ